MIDSRELGDEYRYVFDRALTEAQLGNSLDRPSLLNKRLFNRKTQIDEENLRSGGQFQALNEAPQMMMQQQMIQPKAMYMQQNVMMSHEADFMPMNARMYGGHHGNFGGGGGGRHTRQYHTQDSITDYQNFLKDAPLVSFNQKPDANGQITFKDAKLANYSNLQVIVLDDSSVMQSSFNLKANNEPNKRDLVLKKSLNETKGLTQSRRVQNLQTGEQDHIEDYTSSEIMIVDDLNKVHKILTEIGNLRYADRSNEDKWKKLWNMMRLWPTLNQDRKNFFFSEYYSHEVNYFIKKRDKAYFDSTVKPFLQSKMEKSFVDLYLLDQDEQIMNKYT